MILRMELHGKYEDETLIQDILAALTGSTIAKVYSEKFQGPEMNMTHSP